MFWIWTQDDNLCNLAFASDIRTVRNMDGTRYEVIAYFPAGEQPDKTVLFTSKQYEGEAGKLAAKGQCEVYIDRLYAAIPHLSKLTEL